VLTFQFFAKVSTIREPYGLLHETPEILDHPNTLPAKSRNCTGCCNFFAFPQAPPDFYKMKKFIYWLFSPAVTGSANILVIRVVAGTLFCWEGILKITLGTANHFVAAGEIAGGLLLLLGLLTRFTALLFIVEITLCLILNTPIDATSAIIRLIYAKLLITLFLLLEGPGRRSLDFRISTANKIYRMP
jgi:putative oxidoreductase